MSLVPAEAALWWSVLIPMAALQNAGSKLAT
jgi:hypothetical protein